MKYVNAWSHIKILESLWGAFNLLSVCRFWEMALTFTGLKLQGLLGRFGKTATTDIEGYMELPDGKVSTALFHNDKIRFASAVHVWRYVIHSKNYWQS